MPPRGDQLALLESAAASTRSVRRQACRSRKVIYDAAPAAAERRVLAELVIPMKAGELGQTTGLGALFLTDLLEDLERRGLIRSTRRGFWERIRDGEAR